jgi:hypothetical protein
VFFRLTSRCSLGLLRCSLGLPRCSLRLLPGPLPARLAVVHSFSVRRPYFQRTSILPSFPCASAALALPTVGSAHCRGLDLLHARKRNPLLLPVKWALLPCAIAPAASLRELRRDEVTVRVDLWLLRHGWALGVGMGWVLW